MNDREHIVRLVAALSDGEFIIEHPDGRLEKLRSQTDWARVDAMTDAEIEASIADDPDWQGLENIDWSTAEVVVPANKVPISIRLDPDVLDFFKAGGAGYQRRINAVLRAYVREARRRPAAPAAARKVRRGAPNR